MSSHFRLFVLLACLAAPTAVSAADQARKPDPADTIAKLIDQRLAADWQARGITPAALADDAEFIRRVYLDLIGRIPRVAETRAFLEDRATDKRSALIDKLLQMPGHAQFFASITRAAWLPQTLTNNQFQFNGTQFEEWLRSQFKENVPADEMIRRVLSVPAKMAVDNRSPVPNFGKDRENMMLASFYQANDSRPENVGAAVSRLFLGVKLECAQCHDHPFDRYTRQQFWEFAAFFADLSPIPTRRPGFIGPIQPQSEINRLTIPKTDRTVIARFFDGSEPEWTNERIPRQDLARWLTSPENEFFSRNLANRMWAHFFGYGIQEPLDEPGDANPPSHPDLLNDLGKAFAAAKFDNRELIRGITRSRAYQLSSKASHPSQMNPRAFARMSLKGLTPSQLFDSIVIATGHREPSSMRQNTFNFGPQPNNPRSQFLNRFSAGERSTETHTTILQALMLMNSKFIGDVTSLEKGEVLVAIAEYPGWETNKRISALFLTAFSREPSPEELEKYASYVERGGARNDKKRALADVFWVLLNSPEFLFNH